MRDVDAVVVPVGGAGLIAGIALAIKTLKPEVMVIGAQPELCPSFSAALEAGKPVHAFKSASLADGLTVPMVRLLGFWPTEFTAHLTENARSAPHARQVGGNAFKVARKFVDRSVTVTEKQISLAMLRLVEIEKFVVEGGGATGTAPARFTASRGRHSRTPDSPSGRLLLPRSRTGGGASGRPVGRRQLEGQERGGASLRRQHRHHRAGPCD